MKHLIVTCTCKSHFDFLSFCYPQEHIKAKYFMPQAGAIVTPFSSENLDDYLKKRTVPILFAGSFMSPERRWTELPLDVDTVNLLNDIADYVLACDCVSLEEACNYVLAHRGLELSQGLRRKLYSAFLPLIDKYIAGYCRYRCLEAIAKAELPIAVYNDKEWCGYLPSKKYKSITYIGTRNYHELLNDLQKTRLCLSTTTNLLYGASERIFDAMLGGAVTVMQANYSEEFVDGQDSVLYKWTRLNDLPSMISHLLENPEVTWQIAQAAKVKAQARHTWLHRAEQVLDMVKVYKDLHKLTS